jgi:hypothetical protein
VTRDTLDKILGLPVETIGDAQRAALDALLGERHPDTLDDRARELYDFGTWLVLQYDLQCLEATLRAVDRPEVDQGVVPRSIVDDIASIAGVPEPVVDVVFWATDAICDVCVQRGQEEPS